jgi:O-antigen ligase
VRLTLLAGAGGVGVALVTALFGPEWGMLIVPAVAALVAAVYLPGVVLALFFLIPVYKAAVQPLSPIDITVVLALLNLLQVVALLWGRRARRISTAGLALWICMALLVLAAVLWSPDRSVALGRAVTVWALLFVPVVPAALRVGSDERYLRQVVWTFFAVGLVTVLLGVSSLSSTERLTVLDANTIQTARVALLVPLLAVLVLAFPRERPTVLRALAVVLSLGAVIVALATGSRGPLVALILIGVIGALRILVNGSAVDRRFVGAIAAVAIASAMIIASGAVSLPGLSTERYQGLGEFFSDVARDSSTGTEDTSIGVRTVLFGFAIELFQQNPIAGAGTAGYPTLSPRELGSLEAGAYPHNAALQIAAEYGLAGLAIMGSLVLLALTRSLPSGVYARAVRLLFVYYLLNSMVSADVFDDRATWGLMMLILLIDAQPRLALAEPVAPASESMLPKRLAPNL